MDAYFRVPELKNERGDVIQDKNDWYRPALYVVIDTFNDYILGYAWGDTITKELIKEAYRNAQRHVARLTGGDYCWQQIQTDRWGISGKNTTELEQFYTSMATFTPAALKNAQSKYVEASFGTVWHQTLKACFLDNYSGYNVGSKKQINREELNPKSFPGIDQAEMMIEAFVWAMRSTKRNGQDLTRHEEWLNAFEVSDKSKRKLLSTEQRLRIFGKLHPRLNRIKASGLTPTLMGTRMSYELSQDQIFEHNGKEVQIYYDERDLSEVLVTDAKGTRFVARTYQTVPAAFADYEEGDGARIKALQDEKRTLVPRIQAATEKRDAILERARIDANSLIMGGVMNKQISHQAQRVITSGNGGGKRVNIDNNGHERGGVEAENERFKTVKKPLNPPKTFLDLINED